MFRRPYLQRNGNIYRNAGKLSSCMHHHVNRHSLINSSYVVTICVYTILLGLLMMRLIYCTFELGTYVIDQLFNGSTNLFNSFWFVGLFLFICRFLWLVDL